MRLSFHFFIHSFIHFFVTFISSQTFTIPAAGISSTGINLRKRNRIRVGFTLSGALFRKKWGALHLGRQTLFFLEKTGDLFSYHRPCVRCHFSSKTGHLFCSSLSFIRGSPIIFGMQKFAAPFVVALFVGAPVRPNMLNMPKSAAE